MTHFFVKTEYNQNLYMKKTIVFILAFASFAPMESPLFLLPMYTVCQNYIGPCTTLEKAKNQCENSGVFNLLNRNFR